MRPCIATAPIAIHVTIQLGSPIQITQNSISAHTIRIASIRSQITDMLEAPPKVMGIGQRVVRAVDLFRNLWSAQVI